MPEATSACARISARRPPLGKAWRTGWAAAALGVSVALGCSDGTAPNDGEITLTVSPASATVRAGDSREISATLTGTSSDAVSWSTSCGSLSGTSGAVVTFLAPWAVMECTVTAVADADATKSASAVLQVTPLPANQNLIANGRFDTDLSGWFVFTDGNGDPRAQWNDEDASGSAGSGSVEIEHLDPGTGATRLGLRLCLPSVPGRSYSFSVTARLLSDVPPAFPGAFIASYEDDQCTVLIEPEEEDDDGRINFSGNPMVWTTRGTRFTTPPGTAYLGVFVGLAKGSGVFGESGARFDDLVLVQDE